MRWANLPTELSGVCAKARVGHPLSCGVRVIDPLAAAEFVLDLLQDHHFPPVVESLIYPNLPNATALESLDPVVHLVHQHVHVVDRRHHTDHHPADLVSGEGRKVDLLDTSPENIGGNIVGAGNVE